MKKILIALSVFLATASPAFAYTSESTNYIKVSSDPARFQCDDYPGGDPTICNSILSNFNVNGTTIYVSGGSSFDGTYTVTSHGIAGDNVSLSVDPSPGVDLSAGGYGGAIFSTEAPVIPPVEGSITTVIENANAGFENATGVSLNSIITWMASIILIFIGSGLALLSAMKFWIVALIAILVITLFAFKGLRFILTARA